MEKIMALPPENTDFNAETTENMDAVDYAVDCFDISLSINTSS